MCDARYPSTALATTTQNLIGVYPDSNIYYPAGTPTLFYIWSHRLRVSFDPASPFFSSYWQPASVSAPSITIDTARAYYIDSINIAGTYRRINNYTGTPYVDVIYTSDTGAWDATYRGSGLVAYNVRYRLRTCS